MKPKSISERLIWSKLRTNHERTGDRRLPGKGYKHPSCESTFVTETHLDNTQPNKSIKMTSQLELWISEGETLLVDVIKSCRTWNTKAPKKPDHCA